jgi:ParB/RepB/Spo0J family partition protein
MSIQELPVELIRMSPYNTRGEILDEDLESLVQSIRETGLVEPLKVRTVLDGAYELVSGERRLRAMKILGIEHASCIMREMSDAEVLLEQWAENEERKGLSDYGKALKLRQILDALKITQDELADKLGKTKGWVSQHLSILKLGKKFTSVNLHDLTEFQARTILSAPDEDVYAVCAEVERYYEDKGTLPSAANITDFIKSMRPPGTLENEFNGIVGRLGIGPSPRDLPSKSKINTSEEPRYETSEEEIFAFLDRFKYEKDVDGFLLDSMIGLFGLSASQAHDWLERWRNTLSKSPKPTPEEKAIIDEYEKTHPKEDDPLKKLIKYYPPEIMDTILSRVRSENVETILKYCRRYIEELHIRAPDDLRKATLEAIRW